jgi:TonB family protein
MKYLLFLFSIISTTLFAQNQGANAADTMHTGAVFTIVQQMPKFKGNLNEYLSKNIKYPEAERKAGITATVYVSFVVEKDGTVTGTKVINVKPVSPGLGSESIRVVSSMPPWTPGMQNGHIVRVQFNLPIRYELPDNNKTPQQQESGKF